MNIKNMRLRLSSTNPDEYNTIRTTINTIPDSNYAKLMVTQLTTNCSIQVLSSKDYLKIMKDGKNYTIQFMDYTGLSIETWLMILNTQFEKLELLIEAQSDSCGRLVLVSNTEFSIVDMSYNVRQLMGLYYLKSDELPLFSILDPLTNTFKISVKAVGYFLSTPILHLLSNIGSSYYMNDTVNEYNIQSASVVMTITNSFSENMPIIASNGEIETVIPAKSITKATFVLVDANNQPVHLLNPMYLIINISSSDTLNPE